MPKIKQVKELEEVKTSLTSQMIAEAATNDSVLVKEEVVLGEPPQTFKIKYLPYDDQIVFLTLLSPVFEDLLSRVGATVNVDPLNFQKILLLCKESLPELGKLILKQSKPEITIEEVKVLCESPFKICELVLIQINKNNLIGQFSSFFPMLGTMMR